jgi:hypothetical protein
MWDSFKLWLADYLDHTSLVQLIGDTWKYASAMVLVVFAIKYVRRRLKRRN